MPSTVAIIQARIGSKRLPGKTLLKLAGKPVLQWVVEAAKRVPNIDVVVVATPDALIEQWCKDEHISIVRGPEDDVLGRYATVARKYGADVVVRLTADCPFLDSAVISDVVRLREMRDARYARAWGYPDGLDVECFTTEVLLEAAAKAVRIYDREHVTPYIQSTSIKRWADALCPLGDMSKERWTLDTEADFSFCARVAEHLRGVPSYQAILYILDQYPRLREINNATAFPPLPARDDVHAGSERCAAAD
jgi:glutamate-1-semialdehyde 2,1-aminomutase